ncbi:ATP-dependent Clp protease proteolytic subunit [archaeon]|nr:MAG: ATP-dependent Clp protease proteolytic subunit [archaeon]
MSVRFSWMGLLNAFTIGLLFAMIVHGLVPIAPAFRKQQTHLHAGGQIPVVPYFPNKFEKDQYMWMDIYNALGRDRTLFVSRYLDEEACNQLVSSLIWLQGQSNTEAITIYLNVPGAMIRPTMAVYDVMSKLKCPLITINTGLTVGVSTVLAAAGTKRYALPNSRFLVGKAGLDDPVQGQAQHIALEIQEIMKGNEKFIAIFSRLTGQPVEKLRQDLRRDFYLTAPEAAAYGLIDEVMLPPQPIKIMRNRGIQNSIITFGHFAEARSIAINKENARVPLNEKELDAYAAEQMKKQAEAGRINPRPLTNVGGPGRFAGARCKPPGSEDDSDGGGGNSPGIDKNLGQNSGF